MGHCSDCDGGAEEVVEMGVESMAAAENIGAGHKEHEVR